MTTQNWEPGDSATEEKMRLLLDQFFLTLGLVGEQWEHFQQEVWQFTLKDLEENRDLGVFYTIEDAGSKIWHFWFGYRVCYEHLSKQLNQLTNELAQIANNLDPFGIKKPKH